MRLITVSSTWLSNASTTRSSTSRECSVRGSYIVPTMPSSSIAGLSRSRTFSIVSTSSATPRSAKYSQASGMSTPCAAVSAFTVSRPSEGWQSIRMTS